MIPRRTLNSSTIRATSSCGPFSASIAAICSKLLVHETLLMISLLNGSTSAGGRIAKPRRQPVIAHALLKPSSTIVRSAIPGSDAIETCSSPSYRIRP